MALATVSGEAYEKVGREERKMVNVEGLMNLITG